MSRQAVLCLLAASIVFLFAPHTSARALVRRSAQVTPKWTSTTPPADSKFLYFVGFASGSKDLEEAREHSIRKAMAEIVSFIGQKAETTFLSETTETDSSYHYRVSLKMRFMGEQVTLRGISLADTYYEEYETNDKHSFDFYTLVQYPLTEYRAVMADLEAKRRKFKREQRERAKAALGKYLLACQCQQSERFADAVVAFQEASELLKKIAGVVVLDHAEIHNTDLLRERLKQEMAKAVKRRDASHRTLAIRIQCMIADSTFRCDGVEGALIELAATMGFRTQRADIAEDVFDALMEGKQEPAVTTGKETGMRFLFVGRIQARHSSETAGICYARACGTFNVIDTRTGKIVAGIALPEAKAGHLDRETAAKRAISALKKKLVRELRKVLRNLRSKG